MWWNTPTLIQPFHFPNFSSSSLPSLPVVAFSLRFRRQMRAVRHLQRRRRRLWFGTITLGPRRRSLIHRCWRGAQALREINKSSKAKKLFELMKKQEETRQAELSVRRGEYQAKYFYCIWIDVRTAEDLEGDPDLGDDRFLEEYRKSKANLELVKEKLKKGNVNVAIEFFQEKEG